MRKVLWVIIPVVVFACFWVCCFLDWHIKRNDHNQLPVGQLVLVAEDQYEDEAGLLWELQPHSANVLHQTKQDTAGLVTIYPHMDVPPQYDPENPNLKLLCEQNGSSFEAIVQPDGTYLLVGPERGTYNYGHPKGVWGKIRHLFLDVLPHFLNSNYE